MAPIAIGKDNIALEKKKQSALTKAVKKVIKKSKDGEGEQKTAQTFKKGVIMLSHVPHGFYEKEMRGYFSQFGKVLRIKVARSRKTGKSRGYAFVEFEFEEVAKIAAEAMDNYLMFERLIKCKLISPDDGNPNKFFKSRFIRENNNPKLKARKRVKYEQNRILTKEETDDVMKQRLLKLEEQNKRFAELGIDYQFPVPQRKEAEGEDSLTSEETQPTATLPKKKSISPYQTPDKKTKDLAKISPRQFPVPQQTEVESDDSSASIGDEDISDEEVQTTIPKKKSISPYQTPGKKMKDLPKISPKLLRSRKSQGPNIQNVNNEARQTPAKKMKDLPKISPKLLRSRKSQGPAAQTSNEVKKTPAKPNKDLPKISPKMLRSRKSEGPNMQNINNEARQTPGKKMKDLPKISPKLLRSRKSHGPAAQ